MKQPLPIALQRWGTTMPAPLDEFLAEPGGGVPVLEPETEPGLWEETHDGDDHVRY